LEFFGLEIAGRFHYHYFSYFYFFFNLAPWNLIKIGLYFKMKIVFLNGKIGSGKDLAASYLQKKHGYKICRIADILKEITALLVDVPIRDCYDHKKKVPKLMQEFNITLGGYQQKIGTALRREIHPDVFLIRLWNKMTKGHDKPLTKEDQGLDDNQKFVVVDGRLKNEFSFFSKKGATMVRINREFELRKPFLCGRDPDHETETALDDAKFDFVIDNNTMKKGDLYKRIDMILL